MVGSGVVDQNVEPVERLDACEERIAGRILDPRLDRAGRLIGEGLEFTRRARDRDDPRSGRGGARARMHARAPVRLR